MKLTNKKIVGGVIALLAIVSLVQTQAILQIAKASNANRTSNLAMVSSEDQTAQVLSTAKGCIQILPADSNYTSFIDPFFVDPVFNSHWFYVGFKIKNGCNYDVGILRDEFDNDPFGPHINPIDIVKFQDFPNVNNPSIALGYAAGPYVPSSINIPVDWSMDIAFNIPVANFSGVQIHENTNSVSISVVPANSSKNFVVVANAAGSLTGIQHHTRVALKNFRWFKVSDYGDSLLVGTEVKTYNFSEANSKIFTTSYANLNDPNLEIGGPGTKSRQNILKDFNNKFK